MGLFAEFGKLIYRTNEYSGYGKQNYYNNDYYQDGDEVVKIKHNRRKHFDGHEIEWIESDKEVGRWRTDSPDLPEWLHRFLRTDCDEDND